MLAIQTHTTTVHGRLRLCLERCFRFIVKEEENCLSDFFYMKFPKRQNYGDLKHQWFGGKGSEECTEGLQGREKTWYDVLMRDTCHQTFTETVDIQHRGGPSSSYGIWTIIICQWRFISCSKWTTLVRDGGKAGLLEVSLKDKTQPSIGFNLVLCWKVSHSLGETFPLTLPEPCSSRSIYIQEELQLSE